MKPEISPSGQRLHALLESESLYDTKGKPIEEVLITALPNIRYLSGFTGSSAVLLASRNNPTLFTDPRYALQASAQVPFKITIIKGPIAPGVAQLVKVRKLRRLGFERNRISFEVFEALNAALSPDCALTPINGPVEELRMVKSRDEIALIRGSVETNSRAFRRALKSFKPGMRESELAAEIDYQQRRAGAESPAFETIVAGGAHSALPHARPTSAKIGDRGMLLIDMGAFENGYASDMTRTLHVGKAPRRFKILYGAVLEAQLAAIDAVRPGVRAGQIDFAARKVLGKAGVGARFIHSTGHGLGLEIHEGPRIGKKSDTVLRPGFAITVEPGVYFEGYGGIRIEDTVIVTDSGHEVLTPTPKDMLEW